MSHSTLPVQEQSAHTCCDSDECRTCRGKGWYTTYRTV